MLDISMCQNKSCPARGGCVRHESSGTKPSTGQFYENFEWRDGCDNFKDNKGRVGRLSVNKFGNIVRETQK
jgi:hypothetical protein